MKHATPYPDLNLILHELIISAKQVLRHNFTAAWLQGSLAVGDFDEYSDVDFVIVIRQDLADGELHDLQAMHRRIYDTEIEWAKHLEGSYFPRNDIRSHERSGESLWYLDRGSRELERSGHDNTVVVRWILREKGVTLAGPQPSALIDPVPIEALRREILETMIEWGQQILENPEQINNHFYQTFAVLSYCRMLHDFKAGAIGSKRSGAEWAKANLDPSWSGLIDRAWDGRPNPALSVHRPADQDDLRSTLRFIEQVIGVANEFAAATRVS